MKLLLTTTRHTNPRVRSFVRELALSLGNSIKVNRGKMDINDLYLYAQSLGALRVIIVGRGLHGNPGRVVFLDTTQESPRFYPLILSFSGVTLARDLGIKIAPSRTLTPVVVKRSDPEILGFAQELSGAINRPLFEGNIGDLVEGYDKLLLVENLRSKKARFVVKFIDKEFKLAGPRMLVREAVLKEIPVRYYAGGQNNS
ncbi:MAG: hypothetical protein DRJ41_02505 [Thermoprotei archaeon]|nr:MAG: hypothetical protein DRJ41_02505 [Thermoprotei archaeon]